MTGFIITGKVLSVETLKSRSGNNFYKMSIEDNDAGSKFNQSRKYEITIVGTAAKTLNLELYPKGSMVAATGFIDSNNSKMDYLFYGLTAYNIIPIGRASMMATPIPEKSEVELAENEVSDDDLSF